MELYQELLALNQNISRFEHYLFKQYPISTIEHLILVTLSANKTATSSQLAEILNISEPAVRRHVSILFLKGYISNLGYNLDNHLSISLALTASGAQLLNEIDTSIQQNNNQLLKKASDQQINQLVKDLRTLNFSLAVLESDLSNK